MSALEQNELRSAATAVARKDQNAQELIDELRSILRAPNTSAHETYER
jgi:hypothetical protein